MLVKQAHQMVNSYFYNCFKECIKSLFNSSKSLQESRQVLPHSPLHVGAGSAKVWQALQVAVPQTLKKFQGERRLKATNES